MILKCLPLVAALASFKVLLNLLQSLTLLHRIWKLFFCTC